MFLLALAVLPALAGQTPAYRPPPNYVAGGKADQAEGAHILADFHQAGIKGMYWLSFQLEVMPRHGSGRTVSGQLFGTRNEHGPLTRLEIGGQTWLIQGGPPPVTCRRQEGSAVRDLTAAETLEPVAGTDLSVFDLQMPFLFWTDFVYEGLARVRGRPAHSFVLYPPKDLAASRPGLTGVRIMIDTQFQALVQAEVLGAKGVAEKSITVLDLKKAGDQWLVKAIDLRNHLTRDKTRFNATAAALDLVLPAEVFDAEQLAKPAPAVPAEKVQQL